MTQSKHTPTPWHAEGINIWQSGDENTIPIAYVDTEASQSENKANAAFIVKAVNNHEKLLSALQRMVDNHVTKVNPFSDAANLMAIQVLNEVLAATGDA